MTLRVAAIALLLLLGMVFAAPAVADGSGNNQSTTQLCHDADYADLHPTICAGPFSLGPSSGGAAVGAHGSTGGVLGGLLHGLTGGLL